MEDSPTPGSRDGRRNPGGLSCHCGRAHQLPIDQGSRIAGMLAGAENLGMQGCWPSRAETTKRENL